MSTYGLQSYLETSRQVAERSGDSSTGTLLRMLAAKCAYGLSANEYGLYRLYERPWSRLKMFMTKKQTTALFSRVNPDDQCPAVQDKFEFHRRCTGAGLPVPVLRAVLSHDRQAAVGDIPRLASFRDALESLVYSAGTQWILKPRRDALGTGVRFVELRACGPVDFLGQPIDIQQFDVDLQVDMQRDDYLVQHFVRPHPCVAGWASGKALGTLRIVTFVRGADVDLLYALARIPCGRNVHDNFSGGSSGNLVACISAESGRLQLAFGRRDNRFSRLLEAFEFNPDTGRPIAGEVVPDWDEVRATVRRAALEFRSLPLLGWDIALSTDGIVIIEANSNPDIIGAQVSSGLGARELLHALI